MEHLRPIRSRPSLLEAIVFLGAFIVDFWILRGLSNPLFELPALCVVAGVFGISIQRRGGFDRIIPKPVGSSARAWFETLGATAIPAIFMLMWAATIRGSYEEIPLKIGQASILGLTIWLGQHLILAALQQILLLLFLRPVIGEILRNPGAATATTALVFGILHLPCPILVATTTVLGMMWMALFSRYGRIAPMIASHAALAALAYVVIPPQWSCELLVGVVAQREQPRYHVLRSPETRELLETVTSPEYSESSGTTDRIFVESLYRDMLGRAPADDEVELWLEHINEGLSRNRVAVAFAGSEEFRLSRANETKPSKGP